MFRETVQERQGERVLIASSDNAGRRLIGEVAKAAGLRAVGFIREAGQVGPRVRLSQPEVLLLDEKMMLELQAGDAHVDAFGLPGTQRLVLFAQAGAHDAAVLRRLGVCETIDLGRGDLQHLQGYGQLLRKALNACADPVAKPAPRLSQAPVPAAMPVARRTLPPNCVVLGASTGGPVALMTLLKMLPKDFALPLAIVQHMPPTFTRMLADRLNAECAVRVVEAEAGMPFDPATVYIAPGGMHMVIEGSAGSPCIGLNSGPLENSCRPAVDVLFRSSARIFGGRQLAIVLTGMGQDGLAGARELYALGSRVMVQDAATSTVWGMPGAIAQAGCADDILPIDKIVPQLLRCI